MMRLWIGRGYGAKDGANIDKKTEEIAKAAYIRVCRAFTGILCLALFSRAYRCGVSPTAQGDTK